MYYLKLYTLVGEFIVESPVDRDVFQTNLIDKIHTVVGPGWYNIEKIDSKILIKDQISIRLTDVGCIEDVTQEIEKRLKK